MKRTFNLAVVITVVLSAATVAFAVAGTGQAPRATDVPVMVTDRAAGVATPPALAAVAAAAPTAHADKPAASKEPKSPGKNGGTSMSASPRPTGSSAGTNSGKKKSSTPKPSGTPSGGSAASGASDDDDDDFEVVKPTLRDSDDDDDDHESDDVKKKDGNRRGSDSESDSK